MDCQGLLASAHAYFTGELDPGSRVEFDAHAASCTACGEFVRVCREITCREVNEFLHLYVEGELEAERRAVFERHFAICTDCQSYLETYRQAMALARGAHEARALALPEEVPPDLVRAVLEANRRRP